MNATVYTERKAPRIYVSASITGVDLQEYVPVDLVRNGVTYIILYSMFATLLFVLLCAVLFKNGLSPQKRRLPVVWVLGLAMLAGLLGSTLNTTYWACQLFGDASQDSIYRLWISSTSMLYVTPLITHFALQLRLMSFYPAVLANWRKRVAIATFPTLVKIARTILIGFTMRLSSDAYIGMRNGWADGGSRTDNINLSIFVLQLADTLYASCILLRKFHCLGRRDNALMHQNAHWSLAWLKQGMYALAFGYVLPTFYSLALVICKVVDINPTDLGYVLVANIYIQAFGAVLATLSRSHRWREDRFTSSYCPEVLDPMPRGHRASFTCVESFVDRDGNDHSAMEETEGTGPVSYDSHSSLNVAELGQSRAAHTKHKSSSDFRLKHLIGGGGRQQDGEGRTSMASSRRARNTGVVSSEQHDNQAPQTPMMGLPRLPIPTTMDSPGLQQFYTDLPPGLSFDQLQKRRSSDATLIAGSQALAKGSAGPGGSKVIASGSGSVAERPSSSDASTSSGSSRPGSRGTDRMQRLGSSCSIPLSVTEEGPGHDSTTTLTGDGRSGA